MRLDDRDSKTTVIEASSTVRNILEQAVAVTSDDKNVGLDFNECLTLLDATGPHNAHLRNPLNRDPSVFYWRKREKLLSGNEQVFGRYLTLDYSGHDPSLILFAHDDLAVMTKEIIGPSGLPNPFCTYLIAFIDFKVARFRVNFIDRDGIHRVFRKEDQYEENWVDPGENADWRLEWLNA